MILGVRVLSVLSLILGIVFLGLSAMASDDLSRASEARGLQLLTVAWLVLSIGTFFAVPAISRRWPDAVVFSALPMVVIGITAILRAVRF